MTVSDKNGERHNAEVFYDKTNFKIFPPYESEEKLPLKLPLKLNLLDILPGDLFNEILKKIRPKDIISLAQTNKKNYHNIKDILNKEFFWNQKYLYDIGPNLYEYEKIINFKDQYRIILSYIPSMEELLNKYNKIYDDHFKLSKQAMFLILNLHDFDFSDEGGMAPPIFFNQETLFNIVEMRLKDKIFHLYVNECHCDDIEYQDTLDKMDSLNAKDFVAMQAEGTKIKNNKYHNTASNEYNFNIFYSKIY